jgi:hypothetical protein
LWSLRARALVGSRTGPVRDTVPQPRVPYWCATRSTCDWPPCSTLRKYTPAGSCPTSGTASVLVPAVAGPMQLTLRDALGRVLRRSTTPATAGTSTLAVPEVGQLPAGVYFLNVEQGGQSQVLRVAHQ